MSGSNSKSFKSSLLQNTLPHSHKSKPMSVYANASEKNSIELKQCRNILQEDVFCNFCFMWEWTRYQT